MEVNLNINFTTNYKKKEFRIFISFILPDSGEPSRLERGSHPKRILGNFHNIIY